jgi:hypothetical protein
MKPTSLPQPHEQRKVERLLLKLSKVKPISAALAPIALKKPATHEAYSTNSRVFFST